MHKDHKTYSLNILLTESQYNKLTNNGDSLLGTGVSKIVHKYLYNSQPDMYLHLEDFLFDNYIITDNGRTLASRVYKSYLEYCEKTDNTSLGRKSFYTQLNAINGVSSKLSSGNSLWIYGIK